MHHIESVISVGIITIRFFFYHNLTPTLIVRFKCVNLAGQELTAEESFGLFWKALTDNILALNIMSGLV